MRTFSPRICPNCGKSFVPNWNTRRYCSEACVKEHQKIAANLRRLHGTKSDRAQRRALMVRKIESLQAYIEEMNPKVDKLMTVNGKLCAEINRQERRIRELEHDWQAACDSRARWQEKAVDIESRCIELESLLREADELLPMASWSSVDADQRASDLLGRIEETVEVDA